MRRTRPTMDQHQCGMRRAIKSAFTPRTQRSPHAGAAPLRTALRGTEATEGAVGRPGDPATVSNLNQRREWRLIEISLYRNFARENWHRGTATLVEQLAAAPPGRELHRGFCFRAWARRGCPGLPGPRRLPFLRGQTDRGPCLSGRGRSLRLPWPRAIRSRDGDQNVSPAVLDWQTRRRVDRSVWYGGAGGLGRDNARPDNGQSLGLRHGASAAGIAAASLQRYPPMRIFVAEQGATVGIDRATQAAHSGRDRPSLRRARPRCQRHGFKTMGVCLLINLADDICPQSPGPRLHSLDTASSFA